MFKKEMKNKNGALSPLFLKDFLLPCLFLKLVKRKYVLTLVGMYSALSSLNS